MKKVLSGRKCSVNHLQKNFFQVTVAMLLFIVRHIDNTVSCGKYHSVQNHPMAHEDGMDNRTIQLTGTQTQISTTKLRSEV